MNDSSNAKSIIVIPARMHSTRLPEKMLLAKTGKPLIQHTYEAAQRAKTPDEIVVATDHHSILEAVKAFGGSARMTSPTAQSGTDRIAEVAVHFPDVEIIANVQGDEPEISGEAIDQAIDILASDDQAVMSTLASPIFDLEKILDPACVKVVFDNNKNALYFSRSPIPFARDGFEKFLSTESPRFFQHIGMYCYRREFLEKFSSLSDSSMEQTENLEQLRVLQNGYRIKVGLIDDSCKGIDTEQDYEAFVKRSRS